MTPPTDYDLVCIGSGPAGQRAAVQAAKLGQARLPLPALAECYKVAAHNAANKIALRPIARRMA